VMAHSTGQFNPIRTAAYELINSMKKGVRRVLITIRKTLNLVFIERVCIITEGRVKYYKRMTFFPCLPLKTFSDMSLSCEFTKWKPLRKYIYRNIKMSVRN